MNAKLRILLAIVVGCVICVAVLAVAQMWFSPFPAEVFWKILMTLGIIGGVAGLLIAIQQDISDDKKLKDDKFID
jgi:predicted phage tail protein